MGNEHSSNKKSKSTTKHLNTSINNYNTVNIDSKKANTVSDSSYPDVISQLQKYFKSPSTAKLLFGSNPKVKEINYNINKITRRDKMRKISHQLMSRIPQTLSQFVNIDMISSNFGLDSLDNHNLNNKKSIISMNKGITMTGSLLRDEELKSFIAKSQFDPKEKNSNRNTLSYEVNNTFPNMIANEPSYIKEVMDTNSSFIQILEEFEKISGSVTVSNRENDRNNNSNMMGKNDNMTIRNKSRLEFMENMSKESKSNSNNHKEYNSNTSTKGNNLKNIALKNNMKIIQVNRSKDKTNKLTNESQINEKLNISTDNSLILNKSNKNLLNKPNEQPSKVKNIKINLTGKQKSTSPDKKVLTKLEPTLVIDLSNKRNSKLIKNETNNSKNYITNTTTIRSTVTRTNLSKSPAKDTNKNIVRAEQLGLYSPTDSTHSSQFDSQFLYNSNNELDKSARKSNKFDMNVIKINPKILKTNKDNTLCVDSEMYNTYSQLKKKSIDQAKRDNSISNTKKKLNASNVSDDGFNISVNNSIIKEKINDRKSPIQNNPNKSNNKDGKQIKNINININELNIINKEKKPNEMANLNDDLGKSKLGPKNNTPQLAIENSIDNSKINDQEEKSSVATKSSDQQSESIKNIYSGDTKSMPRDNSPNIKQDKSTNSSNSMASSAIQKLSKLKSLKINLNINQLKKIKNQDKSVNDSNLDLDNTNQIEEKSFTHNPYLEKIESELSESDSNSRGTTPPKRNTPKFSKSINENNHSNEVSVTSTEENNTSNQNYPNSKSNKSNIINMHIINNNMNKFVKNEINTENNPVLDIETETYLTKINYKHHHRKSNSFGGYKNNQNTKNTNDDETKNQIMKEKTEFNPDTYYNRSMIEANDGEKFSFQNDIKDNSIMLNLSMDNQESKLNTSNMIKYVKPKTPGFKRNKPKFNEIQESKILIDIDESKPKIIKSNVNETESIKSEFSSQTQSGADFSTNKSPKNENSNEEMSPGTNKSKILFKKIKN